MNFKSIRTKLTISSAIVIAAMILLIEACIYLVAVRQQLKDSEMLYSELVDTVGKSFDDMHLSFKRGLNFMTMNSELQQTLEEQTDRVPTWSEQNVYLKRLLTDRALLINEMDGFYLYDTQHDLRTFWKKQYRPSEPYNLFPEMEEEWFDPSGKVSARMLNGYLVFTRSIKSMENLHELGFLLAVYDQKELEKRVKTVVSNQASTLIVFDSYGEIVTHNSHDPEELKLMMQQVDFEHIEESQVARLPGVGQVMIAQYVSRDTGWRVVSLVHVRQITRSAISLRIIVFVLGFVGIAIGILIQWILSRKIVGPLNQMVQVVNQVELGNYTSRMECGNRGEDELQILSHAFNQMLEKTDILINQVLRDEIEYRDMQLSLMQAQINPHMLYNTLECINWLAEFDRKEDIRSVTIAFSNLMKSLASGEKIVCMKEELAYIDDFLLIYQILLEGKLRYSIELDAELGEVMIPRLMIQPLVENAVVHGIKKSLKGGQITISISQANGGVLITIMDDGIGINADILNMILKYEQGVLIEEERQQIGLGIRNVIDRLHLVYRGKASFHMDSSCAWGTTVDIFIPDGEEKEYGI